MPNVGFLLGAGASFPFGIPMMRQFYEQFIDYIRTRRSHCMPLIEKLASETSNPDLEFLIQRLEAVRSIRSGLEILGKAVEGANCDLDLADELRGYLDMFLIETCEQFDHRKVQTKLSKFVQLVYENDAYVFTTNYDRLIEVAATNIGLSYSDGFEVASSYPESRWNGSFAPGLRLIKLHGSVNWYEEEESENLFRLERGYSLPSHEYRITHGKRTLRPLMIIPTLEKVTLQRPYSSLMTQFSDALKEIDVLVIVGNSLRDHHLRNTILERAHRLNIILINPAAADQTEVVRRSDVTHAIPFGFEEFIDHEMDSFSALLNDVSGSPPDSHQSRIGTFTTKLSERAGEIGTLTEGQRSQLRILRTGNVEAKLEIIRSIESSSHLLIVNEIRRLALEGNDEAIQITAIDALVNARSSDAAEVLGEIVLKPGPLTVRAEAALALQTLEGTATAEIVNRTATAVANDITISALFSPAQS